MQWMKWLGWVAGMTSLVFGIWMVGVPWQMLGRDVALEALQSQRYRAIVRFLGGPVTRKQAVWNLLRRTLAGVGHPLAAPWRQDAIGWSREVCVAEQRRLKEVSRIAPPAPGYVFAVQVMCARAGDAAIDAAELVRIARSRSAEEAKEIARLSEAAVEEAANFDCLVERLQDMHTETVWSGARAVLGISLVRATVAGFVVQGIDFCGRGVTAGFVIGAIAAAISGRDVLTVAGWASVASVFGLMVGVCSFVAQGLSSAAAAHALADNAIVRALTKPWAAFLLPVVIPLLSVLLFVGMNAAVIALGG